MIRWQTAAGLQKALVKTDIVINGSDVVVEAVSPFLRNPVKIPTPSTFGCPDVLNGLLKHPSRTVMIKPFPHDVASRHLRRALSVFGCISGFAMGSRSSIAYVEFEVVFYFLFFYYSSAYMYTNTVFPVIPGIMTILS